LCPHKISLVDIIGFLKPKPFPHQAFDQIGIVALANVEFECFLIFLNIEISVHVVRQINDEQEIPVLVDLVLDAR